MSEYMARRRKPELNELDNAGTLFENFFDELSAEQTSVPDAIEHAPGVSVSLDERQIALEAIAKLYGQRNMGRGFSKALNIPPYAHDLEKRYRSPDEVAVGMAKKAIANENLIKIQMEKLTKGDELKAAGFNYDDVDDDVAATETEIRAAFGQNTRYADREKKLRRIRKASKARHSIAAK